MLGNPLPLEMWTRKSGCELTFSQCKAKTSSATCLIHCVHNLKTKQLFRESAAYPDNETQILTAVITENYIEIPLKYMYLFKNVFIWVFWLS